MIVFAATAILSVRVAFADRHPELARAFPHPDRIRYDHRSLIIEGKPTFIFSGELHYFRCPRELWRDRMQKMKDAGLNCVDTYLAWNLHEPVEPTCPDDFSKLRDMEQISQFIQAARDLGLYVMIRPGPYICAEVDRGGFPTWLMKYKPDGARDGQFLRGNSPKMLAWDRHWLTAAAKVVRPHLITNVPKGSTGVILWQLENEYDWNGAGITSEVRADLMRALAQASIDGGIDVPLFTCETMDKAFRDDPFLRAKVFDTVNKYPNYDMQPLIEGIEGRAKYQPETFRGVTELQGGWFSQVGGSLSGGHNAAQITQLTLTAIERGCTMINYYMFYGGSNLGYSAACTVTQSYDYNAPLREWGGQEDRYYAVKAIGQMLQEHGQRLIHCEPVELTVEGDHSEVSIYLRQSDDGSQYFFVRNSDQHQPRSGTVTVRTEEAAKQTLYYQLGQFEARILYLSPGASDLADGEWMPKPVASTAVEQSTLAAVPARITSIAAEAPSNEWRPAPAGRPLEFSDIFDQRYVHYRVNFTLSADDLDSSLALLVISNGGGSELAARVNGTEIPVVRDGLIALGALAKEGDNVAEILFENLGCHRFGPDIEQSQGITQISLVPQAARGRAIDRWRMKLVSAATFPAELAEVGADHDDLDWQTVRLQEPAAATPAGKTAVYRTSLTVSHDQLRNGVVLSFPVIDDTGTLFVNGREAGKADDWSRPWNFEITDHLQEGNNSIALVVHNNWDDGGPQKGCKVEPIGRRLNNMQVAPHTSINCEPLETDNVRRFLTHYTLEFELPHTSEALSVPWKLHLEADANAFVILNGHLLGRYWACGPQRDIWLPECWLNFGPASGNVIELQARPTADVPVGRVIKQATVLSYSQNTNLMSSAQ